jgi:hypothetical protein
VTLVRATDLAAKNKSLFGKKVSQTLQSVRLLLLAAPLYRLTASHARLWLGQLGTSDPFVRMEVHQHSVDSSYKKATLCPVYNEEFVMPAKGDSTGLKLTVYDYEALGNHHLIGRAFVPLDEFRNGREAERTFRLESGAGVKVREWCDDGREGLVERCSHVWVGPGRTAAR